MTEQAEGRQGDAGLHTYAPTPSQWSPEQPMNSPEDILPRLLDHFEEHLDLTHLERSRARHLAALSYEPADAPPLVCYLKHTGQGAPMHPYPAAFADPAKMMVNELLQGFTSPYLSLEVHDDAPYCLRPNLGTTIIASMFGAEIRLLEDNLPWVERIGEDRIRQLVDEPLPDVRSGLGQRAVG